MAGDADSAQRNAAYWAQNQRSGAEVPEWLKDTSNDGSGLFRNKHWWESLFTGWGGGLNRNDKAYAMLRQQGYTEDQIRDFEFQLAKQGDPGQWLVQDIMKDNQGKASADAKTTADGLLKPASLTGAAGPATGGPSNYYDQQAIDSSRDEYNALLTAGPARIQRMDATRDSMLKRLAEIKNPYAPGNEGLTQLKSGVLGQSAGLYGQQQSATTADMAQRGITQGSGLAASLNDRNRMAFAKQASSQMGALDQQNYDKSADWNRWYENFYNQGYQQANNMDQQGFNNLLQQADTRSRLAMGIPDMAQRYAMNANQIDAGRMNNASFGQVMPYQVAASQAELARGTYGNRHGLAKDIQYSTGANEEFNDMATNFRRGAGLAGDVMGVVPWKPIAQGVTSAIMGGGG